jgi:cation diffusion facilitator CzcD-associated flavoprotein CzcO
MMNVFYLRLSLASLLAPNAAAATQTQSDVIIIGAGAAGMSAAKTLLARDPSLAITILEATDRIGGRV